MRTPVAISRSSWSVGNVELQSAFEAVISYTGNSIYVIFAAAGSWIGAYFSVRWLSRSDSKTTPGGPAALGNPPV